MIRNSKKNGETINRDKFEVYNGVARRGGGGWLDFPFRKKLVQTKKLFKIASVFKLEINFPSLYKNSDCATGGLYHKAWCR